MATIKLSVDKRSERKLMRQLKRLQPRVQRKVQRQAVRKAGRIILKEARATVPVDTGGLRRALTVKTRTYSSASVSIAIVGARLPDGAHQHLVESGTATRRHASGKDVGAMPADPFLERARKRRGREAIKVMREELLRGILKEARR